MVQVYRHGKDRKIEVADGSKLLKVQFHPDVEFAQDEPSKVTGSLFAAAEHHVTKEQLLDNVEGQGNTEKEALLDLIQKLIHNAQEGKKDALVGDLEATKTKVIAEGLGFTHARYVPPSSRA